MSSRKRAVAEEEEGWETIGTVHNVTMNLKDDDLSETVTKVGVNEEPLFRASTLGEKVAGEFIRVQRKTDNSVVKGDGNVGTRIAQNFYRQIKEKVGGAPTSAPLGTPSVYQAPAPTEEKPSLLKNMIDNIENRLAKEFPMLHTHDKISWFIGGLALGLAIAGIVIGIRAL